MMADDARDAVQSPALLDAKAAAELLNVPASWILAQARADRIPHLKLGRYTRFSREELLEWCKTQQRGPRACADADGLP